MARRQVIQVDERGRSYLTRLGYAKGSTIVAERVDGEDNAGVIRPGRVVTDVEYALLGNPANVASLERAVAESSAGEKGTDLL